MLRNCLFCGVGFEPKKPAAKFCSAKHRVYYSRRKAQEEASGVGQKEDSKKVPPKQEVPKTEGKAVVEQSEFMGVKIPEGLTGIKLAVWKNEIKIKAKKK